MPMRFSIAQPSVAANALAKVIRVSDEDRASELGAGLLIQAQAGMLHLLARNDVVTARTSFLIDMQEGGVRAVPARALEAVLASAPEQTLQVNADDSLMCFDAPGWARRLRVTNATLQQFPTFPRLSTRLSASVLAPLLQTTGHALLLDPTHPERSCIHILKGVDSLTAYATDGHRAAFARVQGSFELPSSIPIHQLAIKELRHLLSHGSDGAVDVATSQANLFFRLNDAAVSVRKAGTPPDISYLFMADYSSSCKVASKSLIDALESSIAAIGESLVALTMGKGALLVCSENADRGSTLDEFEAERSGPNVTVRIDGRYLAQAVQAMDSPDVEILATLPNAPLSVRPWARNDREVVLMPMLIPE